MQDQDQPRPMGILLPAGMLLPALGGLLAWVAVAQGDGDAGSALVVLGGLVTLAGVVCLVVGAGRLSGALDYLVTRSGAQQVGNGRGGPAGEGGSEPGR